MLGNVLSTITRLTGRWLGTWARLIGTVLIWPVISWAGKLIKYVVRDLVTLKTFSLLGKWARLGKDGLVRLRNKIKLAPKAAKNTLRRAGDVASALHIPTPGIGNVVKSTWSKLINTLKAIPALPGKIRQKWVVEPTREALDDILSIPDTIAKEADDIFRKYLDLPNHLIDWLKPTKTAA